MFGPIRKSYIYVLDGQRIYYIVFYVPWVVIPQEAPADTCFLSYVVDMLVSGEFFSNGDAQVLLYAYIWKCLLIDVVWIFD